MKVRGMKNENATKACVLSAVLCAVTNVLVVFLFSLNRDLPTKFYVIAYPLAIAWGCLWGGAMQFLNFILYEKRLRILEEAEEE